MLLSQLSETLIGSEIVRLGGEIREKIRQGQKIYNFTVGDFDPSVFPIPKALEDAIVDAYRQHYTNYPAAEGNADLRESIANFIREREKIGYEPAEILVSTGGRPLIYALFRAICDPGDTVIYPVPSWNNNHYTHFVSGRHVVIETGAESRFMPTVEALRPHIKGATLLALCSPQNPTGTIFERQDLEAICDLVLKENESRKEGEKKLYLMYDQMYWHLTYDSAVHYDPVSLRPAMKDYTIYIDAISKVFAATGVRVGWALGPAPVLAKMKSILTHIGAWAPMAEQKAVARFLQQRDEIDLFLTQFREGLQTRLKRIHEGLQSLKKEGFPVDSIAPHAAIYLTVKFDLSGRMTEQGQRLENQEAVTAYLLREAGLAVVPFYAFGADRRSPWYRLSVGTCRLETIPEMLEALRNALTRTR